MKLKGMAIADNVIAGMFGNAKPKMDEKEKRLRDQLLILKQLHEMHRLSVNAAKNAQYAADMAVIEAKKAYAETQVRIELIEMDLGIEKEEGETDAE